jgi:5-methylcytosine-specific restriction endonuclease McrA
VLLSCLYVETIPHLYAQMSGHAHMYNRQWRKARAAYLQAHPLCVMCSARGKLTAATVVDHITPHRGDRRLFWDTNNIQSLCASCHNSAKQQIETNGYARDIGTDGWPVSPDHPANR